MDLTPLIQAADTKILLVVMDGLGGYRTPVDGLWLCGAGTHPGGGVTGANGRNCARRVLADARRRRWTFG